MVTNHKCLLSFNISLYNFLITLNFPKNLIINKQILKRLMEHSSSLTLKKLNLSLKIFAPPNATSRNNDLMTRMVVRKK